jgi:prevent-host-death family protein
MTTLTIIVTEVVVASQNEWTVASAKAHLSRVIEQAIHDGPQTITRNGRSAVVVVSVEEWETRTRRRGNLADFFAESPLRNSGLGMGRSGETPGESGL